MIEYPRVGKGYRFLYPNVPRPVSMGPRAVDFGVPEPWR